MNFTYDGSSSTFPITCVPILVSKVVVVAEEEEEEEEGHARSERVPHCNRLCCHAGLQPR